MASIPSPTEPQRRLVLDPSVTEESFYPIAKIQGWLWWNTAEETEDRPREVTFATLDKQTSIHFVDDSYLETRFLIFRGAETSAAYSRALAVVAHRADGEILEDAVSAVGKARADAVLALAAIAAQVDRSRALEALQAASKAEEPMVRRAGIVAIGYLGWPELVGIAETLRESDSDPQIREDARSLVEGFELQRRGLL